MKRICLILLLSLTVATFAHPGRTDKNGGYIVQDIATGNFEDRYFFKNLAEVEEFTQMDKWTKINKVTLSKSGKGNTTAKISVPLQWLQDLGISESDKDVKLTKKGKKIILEKAPGEEEI